MSHRVVSPKNQTDRDRGSTLILCLVLVLIAGFFVIPLMTYATTVLASNRIVHTKTTRTEAVEGSIRVALYDTTKLYDACKDAGAIAGKPLAPLVADGIPAMTMECTVVGTGSTNQPDQQRWAIATTQAGSGASIPVADPVVGDPELDGTIAASWCTSKNATPPLPCGRPYPGNGAADTTAWHLDSVDASTEEKVFSPLLPVVFNYPQASTPFKLPYAPACNVFFPGRYPDDVTLSGSTPYYFVSGVYYFEKTLRITGGAKVVVGSGSTQGCVESDHIAANDVVMQDGSDISDPMALTGWGTPVGGTFVFGKLGRLVIDDSAGDVDFVMNRRIHDQAGDKKLNDVSIMSVNGITDDVAKTTSNLDVVAPPVLPATVGLPQLSVLAGRVNNDTKPEPAEHRYSASKLISPATAPTSCASIATITIVPPATSSPCPIVDINLTTAATVKVEIPGYVAVPQGSFAVTTAPAAAGNKTIAFGGGVLAAQFAISGCPAACVVPSYFQIGIIESVVQHKFKIVAETVDKPKTRATAIVQVNETGGYRVNSYTVEAT